MTLDFMNNLALGLRLAGQYEEAIVLFRQLVQFDSEDTQHGTINPMLPCSIMNMADALIETGELQETEKLRREALDMYQQLDMTPEVAHAHAKLASLLFEQGKVCAAEREALLGHEVFDLFLSSKSPIALTYQVLPRYLSTN